MVRSDTLALINADLGDGARTCVKVNGPQIAAVGDPPGTGEAVLDLEGARLLPGLINAHDHLQLNHLPRREPARPYSHAREWIADMDRLRRTDTALKSAVAVPLAERLLLGGVKNLLSGVTTVAHHDPLHSSLLELQYPVRVLARYGWAHSLYLDGEGKTRESQQRTPADWPWIIHAAEGVDEAAVAEFHCLEQLGCLAANTLIVHGVALGEAERRRLMEASAGLIWCPSSNLHLFRATADVAALAARRRVALGTDSRLTGSRDLLAELRIAAERVPLTSEALQSMVTTDAARLLRLPDCGVIAPGLRADLLALPAGLPLERADRSQIRLVMTGGIALYGEPDLAQALGPPGHWAKVRVDGRVKALATFITDRLLRLAAAEPGLEIPPREASAAAAACLDAVPGIVRGYA
ncbi:MAG TPA: amidohydrolase family protein [Steroidobacteraceae bacterium]|nr:amidohydrolase family protein [Steroidobacteraceae bacterium]